MNEKDDPRWEILDGVLKKYDQPTLLNWLENLESRVTKLEKAGEK